MSFNMFYCGQGLWSARPWLEKTGADQGGIVLMEQKANIIPIFIENIYCGAANILKQDMLSIGGEVAVFKYAANCKIEYGNVVIMGTLKHYKQLIKKLAAQPWKLKEVSKGLKILLANLLETLDLQTIELTSQMAHEHIVKSVKISVSENIIEDMGQLPLLENTQNEKTTVFLDTSNSPNDSLLQQYIAAVQSKGYQVIVKAKNSEEKGLLGTLKANYMIYD